MKIIKPNAILLQQPKDTKELYQFIEKIGRTCYKSENNITEDSAERFVNRLAENKHYAMLEHGMIYIKGDYILKDNTINKLNFPKFINISNSLISGSVRSFLELFSNSNSDADILVLALNKVLSDKYPLIFNKITCPLTKKKIHEADLFIFHYKLSVINYDTLLNTYSDNVLYKHLVHTVVFTCDRGVSHELVRHRPCSFAQESTRYCNYSLGKFDNNLTFIKPLFFEEDSYLYDKWETQMKSSEDAYLDMIAAGAKPQEARSILPNSLKTEIVVTANEEEWQHILNLRLKGTTGSPHPQMKEVMEIAYPQLKKASNGRLNID